MHQLSDARSITSFDVWSVGSGRSAFARRLFVNFWLLRSPWRSRQRRFRTAGQDLGDLDQGELLAMTALAARVLAPALLEGDDLRPARLRQDFRRNRCALDCWGAERRGVTADHQHLAERNNVAGLAGNFLDFQLVVGSNAILLAAGLDD